MAGKVSGLAVAEMSAGGLLLYSGLKGTTITATLQGLAKGKLPTASAQRIGTPQLSLNTAAGQSGSGGSASSGSAAEQAALNSDTATGSSSAQAALKNAADAYGWGTGAQWQALQHVEMREAGFNPNALNSSSGAYGLAQALGHGTSGTACPATGRNEYGGFGLSDAEAQAANCGDAGAQAIWMCQYIKETYGSPEGAWNSELTRGWY